MQPLYNPSCLDVQDKSLSELLAGLELPAEAVRVEPQHTALAALPLPANDDSAHGVSIFPEWLAEARAELARAKVALKAGNTAWKRVAPVPGLVTAAEGKRPEVVIGGKASSPSPSRTPSPTPAHAPTKPWEDASEHERAVYDNRALVTFGRPVAISINFSPKILAAANDNARGVLDYLRRRVLRHFKRALLSRPCWVKVETTKAGKVHIHIGMALRSNDDPREFKRIAAQTGGNYSCQGSAPADVREMWGPDGWVSYCGKDDNRTRRHLREALGLEPDARVPLYSATDDIRAEGKRLYEEARQAAKEARQRPAVVEVSEPAPAPAAPASDSQDATAPAARPRGGLAAVERAPLPVPVIVITPASIAIDEAWTARRRHVPAQRPRFFIRGARPLGLPVHNQTNHCAGLLRPSAFARSRGPQRSIKAD